MTARAYRVGLAPSAVGAHLSEFSERHLQCALWVEPGRYLVAEAGVLLATVTQTKDKGPVRYVGLDTGMNSLLRPTLDGAYHKIAHRLASYFWGPARWELAARRGRGRTLSDATAGRFAHAF